MLNIKLKEFILSFNKEKGQYNSDEIYQIGLMHKSLPQKEKNWEDLNNFIGTHKNGEALRHFIYTKSKKTSNIVSNLPEETIDIEKLLETKRQELYIQQVKTSDVLSKYKKALRSEARVQVFKNDLIKAMENLPALPSVEPFKPVALYKSGRQFLNEGVLMLSDLHIGALCNNFYNRYNYEIAAKRMGHLVNCVKEYCLREDLKTLHVLNLGDMIQGIIHNSARLEQEFDVTTQIMVAAEILSRVLKELKDFVPRLTYRSCIDNHSRAIANLHDHIEAENFNNIIDWFLEERLKDTGIEFIKDNIDDGIGKFSLENGKKIVFAHGHRDSTNTALQHFMGATEEFIHYVLLAHEHSEKVKIYQNVRVITNGSVVGTESYALSRRLFNKPSQTLLVFHENNLLNISIELDIQK